MSAESLNAKIRRELVQLHALALIDNKQAAALNERYPTERWDITTLVRWFTLLGAISMAVGGALLLPHLTRLELVIENGLLLGGIAVTALGVWLKRRRALPRTGATVELLGAMGLEGWSWALAVRLATGSHAWPHLIGADCVLLAVLAYALGNRLILILMTINAFVWFGGETGYISGWGAYWLGMNYPSRFLLVGFVTLGIAWGHFRFLRGAYQSFSRVYAHFGFLSIHLSLWFFSLFGYFEKDINWGEHTEQRLLFSALWAAVSLGSMFASSAVGVGTLRAYGMTFLVIDAYTFYFQFIVAHSVEWWWLHMLIVGGSMLFVGTQVERRMRMAREKRLSEADPENAKTAGAASGD